ncbi:MAG: hypothetical protein IPI67_36185 [Myxococcales bacterium]|nr:hypothetical protein [Myxococcales bacterium]
MRSDWLPLLLSCLGSLGCSDGSSDESGKTGGTGGVTSGGGGGGSGGTGGTSVSSGGSSGSAGSPSGGGGASGGSAGSGGGSGGIAGAGGSAGSGGGAGTGGGSATAGCGKSGAFVGVNDSATISVSGVSRSYVLSVPADYVSSKGWPLIFGFHGLNADGKGARNYLKLEPGGAKDAIFVYPTATNKATGWKMKEGEGDVEFFDALLDSLSASHCVDVARVYATGFSHGAMFTNNLTCWRAAKLAAVAPTGGSGPWFGASCTASLPAMITHGNQDPTVPPADGAKTRDYFLKQNGCSATSKPYAAEPACVTYDGCKLPVVWCAFDGGHTVPAFAGPAVKAFLLAAP